MKCLGTVSSILDRDVLASKLVPALEHCIQVDISNSELMITIIDVYFKISKQFDTKFIASKILPTIIPITVEKSLDYDKFTKCMKTVKELLNTIEKERISEFEEMQKLEKEANTTKTDMKQVLEEDDKINSPKFEKDDKISSPQFDKFDTLLNRFMDTPKIDVHTPLQRIHSTNNQSSNTDQLKPVFESSNIPSLDALIEKTKDTNLIKEIDLTNDTISSITKENIKSPNTLDQLKPEITSSNIPSLDSLIEKQNEPFVNNTTEIVQDNISFDLLLENQNNIWKENSELLKDDHPTWDNDKKQEDMPNLDSLMSKMKNTNNPFDDFM